MPFGVRFLELLLGFGVSGTGFKLWGLVISIRRLVPTFWRVGARFGVSGSETKLWGSEEPFATWCWEYIGLNEYQYHF